VYDVLYIDEAGRLSVLAAGLTRDAALEMARSEAKQRNSARLFLRGSDSFPRSNAVVIIRSGPERPADAAGDRAA
jgi:hypothetical protein